jgi:hypothetical protein
MAVKAELHDGRILEFPDGTDPSVVQATVKSQEDATKAFNKMQLLNRKDWKQTVERDYGGDAKAAREAWIANERGTALPNSVDTMMGNRTSQAAPQQTRTASNPKVIKLD